MRAIYLLAQVRLLPIVATLPNICADDGSLRVYDLSSYKVLKAVRGLGAEVSSIICVKRAGSELRDAWIAHDQKACVRLWSVLKYVLI